MAVSVFILSNNSYENQSTQSEPYMLLDLLGF